MRKKIYWILGIVCLFLFGSSVIRAEKLSVPACDFIAEGHQAGQLQLNNEWGDHFWRQANASEEWYYAPVNLPHGAIVTGIRLHFVDNSDYNILCFLGRVNKYNGVRTAIYSLWTSGRSSVVRHETDLSPLNPPYALINNTVCTYWIGIQFWGGFGGTNRKIYGVTIYYE
jgi:hypothetical protein